MRFEQGYTFKLAGEALSIRPGGTVSASLAYGTRPQVISLEVMAWQVETFTRRGESQTFQAGTRTREQSSSSGPMTLEVTYPPDPSRNVKLEGLYLIGVGPGDRLNTRVLQLADRRWLAPRTVVRRRYNLRRDSGNRRLVGAELVERTPIQLGVSVADPTFRLDTLKDGRPWTAREVLEDVLEEVFGPGAWEIPSDVIGLSDDAEAIDLWDRGDEALARVAALLPGVEFFVDYDGRVKVGNVYDGTEVKLLEDQGDPNAGDWKVLDRSTIIPQDFAVSFMAETELRFDFDEDAQSGSTGTQVREEVGRETLQLENVIRNPLLRLVLADGTTSTIGEFLPVQTWLDAVNLLVAEDGLGRAPITQAQLRRVWLGDWSGWMTTYLTSATSGAVRLKWQALFAELRSHWRRTFRVLPAWRDKLEGLTALRAAIVDNENGERAPATVHAQWIMRISQLGLEKRFDARQNLVHDDYAADLSESQVSPFNAVVLSRDQGLIQLVPRTDEEGVAQGYTLGQVDEQLLPSGDIRDAAVIWGHAPLSAGFKVAVILSALRANPNGIEACHQEVVTLADAAERLGVAVPKASGPRYELRGFEDRARFAWRDSDAEAIREAYYSGAQFPAGLLVNTESMRSLALAHAARKLAEVLPRAIGSARWPLRQVSPTGGARQVTHTIRVGPDGAGAICETTITCPGEVSGPSVWSLLPEGVRRVLRGQVER